MLESKLINVSNRGPWPQWFHREVLTSALGLTFTAAAANILLMFLAFVPGARMLGFCDFFLETAAAPPLLAAVKWQKITRYSQVLLDIFYEKDG